MTHAAPIAPAIPPALPTVPETQPTRVQKTGNIVRINWLGEPVGGSQAHSRADSRNGTGERRPSALKGPSDSSLGKGFLEKKKPWIQRRSRTFGTTTSKESGGIKSNPQPRNKLFTDYYLLLTPKSSSIVGILAVRDYSQIWSAQLWYGTGPLGVCARQERGFRYLETEILLRTAHPEGGITIAPSRGRTIGDFFH